MSLDVIARVEAFDKKAFELSEKGHILRSAEYYGRAASAARALGAENLVMLSMQVHQGYSHGIYATAQEASGADPHVLAAHRAECIALLVGAVEALERRRVAGTLLEGKCAAAEEAWYGRGFEQRDKARMPAAMAATLPTLVGYKVFLQAAADVSNVLGAGVFAAECTGAQFQCLVQHVVHAAELMRQPRRHGVVLELEATFTQALRSAVANAGANGLHAHLAQLLEGAMQRLQRSGVLQARGIEKHIGCIAPMQEAIQTAVERSLSAPGLRSCALPGCGAREAHPAHFKSCAACRAVVYCCREHQVAGWPGHKTACKAARKAAAAEEDGVGPSGA